MAYHSLGAGVLALAALISGLTGTLTAAVVPAPVVGDLFLAFRTSGGQGASTSYIIDIGSDLTYRNAAPGSILTLAGLGNVGADLSAAYGINWSSRSDLYWGVFGARLGVSSSVYASSEQDPVGSSATAWPSLSQTARNATATSIIDVITGIGGYTGSEATVNNPVGTLQLNSGSESSYFKQVATAGTTDFGSLSQWSGSGIEGDFGGGTAGTALDLFRIAGTQSANLGTFTIGDNGGLSFTAIPEPGAVFLLGGVMGLLGLRRRRA